MCETGITLSRGYLLKVRMQDCLCTKVGNEILNEILPRSECSSAIHNKIEKRYVIGCFTKAERGSNLDLENNLM